MQFDLGQNRPGMGVGEGFTQPAPDLVYLLFLFSQCYTYIKRNPSFTIEMIWLKTFLILCSSSKSVIFFSFLFLHLIYLSFYTWSIYHYFFYLYSFVILFLVFLFIFLGKKILFFILYTWNICHSTFNLFVLFFLLLSSFFYNFFSLHFIFEKLLYKTKSKWYFTVVIVTLSYFSTTLKINLRY
jgi:hypothetical protein